MQEGKWSLDALYPSYESAEYQADLARFEAIFADFEALDITDSIENIKAAIKLLEEYTVLVRRLFAYSSLQLSTDTSDQVSLKAQAKLRKINAAGTAILTKVSQFIGATQIDPASDPDLADYDFYFQEAKQENQHRLSDEVETVIARMNMSAGAAWSQLQSLLTSTVEHDFKGRSVNLSEIRNLAYDPDPEIRKAAYETELVMYDTIKEPVAFALNNIKSQVIDLADLRGYESPLAKTLEDSRMSQATLDALLEAIKESLPAFRKYFKHKGKLLGHDQGLPFYDLFAPMGSQENSKTYTPEEAKNYLVKHFSKFSPDLADMVETMYQAQAIDYFPRKGKRGGAFCSNLPFIDSSRIMLNFEGSLSDIVTFAHELGHAYHGVQIADLKPLNWSYTMPVAETASTFNEALIMESLLSEADDQEKISLLESQISDTAQIIVDIYSRFLFEDAVFRERQDQFLFSKDLEAIMLDAQKQSYGEGLDPDYLHPYMWVCKSHYYSTGLSYYNFPYAFGGLFSRGLYALYQAQPDGFVAKYKNMLKATTTQSVEDTAAIMGLDVTTPAFWTQALDQVAALIDQFIALTSK
ncbi:M3 family oligoendopeptidase [Eremococcus coleocola]|uniref:M3 family oligoendopeptidase n=1 Tax=Eremococcus coleocola TaxID=88132 RepID=UPI00040613A5|nr:M3 family oligoendopeptidase [Eremococcus coleocola]